MKRENKIESTVNDLDTSYYQLCSNWRVLIKIFPSKEFNCLCESYLIELRWYILYKCS